jgi:hypothetical protein
LPPCGAATMAAHNRPSRTITLLLVCSLRLSVCGPLCGCWVGPTMAPARPGRAVVARPHREDADNHLATTSSHAELSWRPPTDLGAAAGPGPC